MGSYVQGRGVQAVGIRQYAGWYRGGVPFKFDEIT